MFKKLLDIVAPDRGVTVHKPNKDGMIVLPNGCKIQKSAKDSKSPLAVHQVVEIDGKFFGRRKRDGQWVRDPFPIEFE